MKNLRGNYKNPSKTKGFSAIELIAVIGFLIVLAAAVYGVIVSVSESSNAKVAVDDFRLFDSMVVGARGPSSYNLTGITVGEVVATDKSSKLARDTNSDGSITAADTMFLADVYELVDIDATTVTTTDDAYIAAFTGFTDQDCDRVARSLWDFVDQIEIVAGTGASASITTNIKSSLNAPIDTAASTAISGGCANGDNNAIVVAKRIKRA